MFPRERRIKQYIRFRWFGFHHFVAVTFCLETWAEITWSQAFCVMSPQTKCNRSNSTRDNKCLFFDDRSSPEQFAFPALILRLWKKRSPSEKKEKVESAANSNCRRETFPQLFLPPRANNRAAANIRTRVICPSLLSREWVTAWIWWGGVLLRWLYGVLRDGGEGETERKGGDASDRRRGGAGRFRRAERRRSAGETVSIRQPAGGTQPTNPYGCLRNTETPPLPPFSLFLWDFWLFLVAASLISCSKLKKWIHLPWTSRAVMDTHIRWKVKRRIRDIHITVAVLLLFVASRASSGKTRPRRSPDAAPSCAARKYFCLGLAHHDVRPSSSSSSSTSASLCAFYRWLGLLNRLIWN